MKYLDIDSEIDCLESTLSSLHEAIESITDSPYHSYMASSWELDLEEIKSRLDELYELQSDQWTREMKEQNFEYERSAL